MVVAAANFPVLPSHISPLGSAHGPLLLLPPVLGVDRLAEEALRGLIDLRRHLA